MDNKLKTVDAETLLSTPMSKTMFIVDGLISQGVNVISGASKIGKSWLMLWLGLQVAQGSSIWGLPTLQCDVLYLSLEDTQRRIKDRLYNLTDSAPDNLYFAVTSGLIGGGLEEQITDFLTEHPATKLVIIDTLQKVRDSKGSAGKAGMYGNDYDDISSIKRIADGFNIAILLVHHLRKLQDSDDPFNDVSGSTGIIGAADTNFILRRKRSGNAATLLVSGRDVEYQELTLQFNDLVWELVERKNSEDIHKAELPKFLFRVVDFMECRTEWVGTATELLTEMKEQEVTPNMVTKYLGQFAFEVLEPLGIELSAEEKTALLANLPLLESAGLEVNDFGGSSVCLRSVPADVEQGSAEDLLVELAAKLAHGSRDALNERTEWVLHSISCRAAIKAGDHTSPQELMALAEKILSGEVPPFCPHGRPCVLKLTRKELEKQFGRIV